MGQKGLLLGLTRRPKPGDWTMVRPGPHILRREEVGDGIWEVSCLCLAQTYTPWGEESAKGLIRRHLICNGVPVPETLWPEVNGERIPPPPSMRP